MDSWDGSGGPDHDNSRVRGRLLLPGNSPPHGLRGATRIGGSIGPMVGSHGNERVWGSFHSLPKLIVLSNYYIVWIRYQQCDLAYQQCELL